ncbi:MAG TPA: hypothetical protein VNK73_20070 [Actinomycetota bacterium]|nr:hypothetical protein [Actinomycetota bacterium]
MRPTTDTRINPGQTYQPDPYPPPAWPQQSGGPATGSWDGLLAPGWGGAPPAQPRSSGGWPVRVPPPAAQPPMAHAPAAYPRYADPRRAAPRQGSQVPARRTGGGVPATRRSGQVPARRHDSGRHGQPEGGQRVRPGGPEESMEMTARVAAAADAQLLTALKPIISGVRSLLRSTPSLYPRVMFLAIGYTAIGPLAAAYSEVLPLPKGARYILLPAALLAILVGLRHKEWGRRALVGWVAGVAATGIYDVLRLALYKFGYWDDPIPGIGRLMLDNPNASAIWGYVWRFGGNGAGMGMAFAMLPWRGIRSGIIYGTTICFGLFGVLALAPVAQAHFFPLNLKTAIGALAGHWVYGAVLGWLTSVSLPPVRLADLQLGQVARGRRGYPATRRPAGDRPARPPQGGRMPAPAMGYAAMAGMAPVSQDPRTASGSWPAGAYGTQGWQAPAARPPQPGQGTRRPASASGAHRKPKPRDQAEAARRQGGRHIRPKGESGKRPGRR